MKNSISISIAHDAASAEVRRPILEGRQLIAGIWFPHELFSPLERRLRMLQNWRAGASAYAFEQGDLLQFASLEERDCATTRGWPLRRDAGALCSAAMESFELSSLLAADVRLVVGGRIVSMKFADAEPLDPAEWLDVAAYSLLDTYDCRAALPQPTIEVPGDVREIRDVLGGSIPPASPDREKFMREMMARAKADGVAGSSGKPAIGNLFTNGDSVAGKIATVGAGLLIGGMAAVVGWLFGRPRSGGGSGGSSSQTGGLQSRRDSRPPQRWREWLTRFALATRLASFMGRQQAAYVRRMVEMFESGQLEEALRHAIPLGGDLDSLGQAFNGLGPRHSLTLSSQLTQSANINLGPELDTFLKQLYRRSFEKLNREGRIDEAVFVLAELLRSRQEALDYLEKHSRFAQAAELALAWDRPSDVIVRLCCLAGDWRRAIAVARRDASFANAVLMLEKKWPDPARQLRLAWGEALAAQGDWLGAVEGVWPIDSAREQACQWLLSAEAAGGQLAARALVKRAVLLPDTLSTYADYLTALRDEPERHHERAALATALLDMKSAPTNLARVMVAAILADQANGHGSLDKKALQRLLTLAGEKLLNADLPNQTLPVQVATPLLKRGAPISFNAPLAGARAILDAVPLEAERYLVALGEAGAAMINERGDIICRFPVPAEKIVIAASRQIALVLARRGDVWRVSRLDLSNRGATDLGVISCDHHAQEFDGIAWTIVSGKCLRVLDTSRALQSVLWQVNDLPGQVLAFKADRFMEQLLIDDGNGGCEWWRYSLPQRTLVGRDGVAAVHDNEHILLGRRDELVTVTVRQDEADTCVVRCAKRHMTTEFNLPIGDTGDLVDLRLQGEWIVAFMRANASLLVWFIYLQDGRYRAEIEWPAQQVITPRVDGSSWLLFDSQGRLFHLETDNGVARSLSIK